MGFWNLSAHCPLFQPPNLVLLFIIWTSQNTWILLVEEPCKYGLSIGWQRSTGLQQELVGNIWESILVFRINSSRESREAEINRVKSLVYSPPLSEIIFSWVHIEQDCIACLFQKKAINPLRLPHSLGTWMCRFCVECTVLELLLFPALPFALSCLSILESLVAKRKQIVEPSL